MPILEPEDRPHSEVSYVGVAIQKNDFGYHSGLLYKLGEGEARIIHLAFHHMLEDEVATNDYRWAQLGLDEDNLIVLSELLSKIAGREPRIPYGFNSEGIAVDPGTGDVSPSPPGFGLTCATFMVAALKAYGHDLLDASTWQPREDDAEWEASILKLLGRYASPEHVQAVRDNPRSARLRPAEVVGSGTIPDDEWPVNFPTACEIADRIYEDLA